MTIDDQAGDQDGADLVGLEHVAVLERATLGDAERTADDAGGEDLADDEEHGEANRATMQGWLEEYTPKALNAGRNLQPIWSQISEKVVRFEDSLDRSRTRFEGLLSDIGLETPKEA